MKRNSLSTAMPGLLLSLASLFLPPVGQLKADIFTQITTGPGAEYGPSFGGGWGDYDNDGFIDLFLANGNASGNFAHFLYHNNGDGTFSRVTTGPVAAVLSAGMAGAWGDYDNDGHLDLALTNWAQANYLFRNNGAGSFAAVPSSFSTDVVGTSRGVTWVDYDNDGYLDLFRTAQVNDIRRLYRNNRDGTFTRNTQPAFLTVPGGFIGMAWADYNNDGRPDLFLPQVNGASAMPNYLYRNDGGGAFTRVGVGMVDGHSHCTAAAWGDFDNDGDPDLFVSGGANNGESWPNLFYRNDGNDTFTSLTTLPANDPVPNGGSHGCNWGDYDNDGWLDLFVANMGGQNDYLYHNNGNGTFTKVVGDVAVTDATNSWCPLWGDYDRDGSLDLLVLNRLGNNLLYHNNGNDNHWMEFRLIGTRSNRAAIGAKVRVRATINGQSFWQMREVPGGDGQMGQNSLYLHVGLGNATTADLVRIEWPSGTVQELQNVAAGQFHTVTEPPLLSATRAPNGEMQLTLTGRQGSHYEIGTSTDLITWNWDIDDMVTVTNADGTVTFSAPGSPGERRLFYSGR